MNANLLLQFLGWSTLINLSLLLLWFGGFVLARDWIYRLHGRWFRLSPERFDAIHYGGMALFKMTVVVFNLVPYLVLRVLL